MDLGEIVREIEASSPVTNALWTTSLSGTLGESTFGKVVGRERGSREGDPCRRVLLGDAGSLSEATGRCLHGGRIQGGRGSERELPQPRHARGGDRDRLRFRATLLPRATGFLLPDPRSDDAEPSGQRHRDELSFGDLLPR